MVDLIKEALSIGWPIFALLIGWGVYYQISVSDSAKRMHLIFKVMILLLCTFLAFIAIANYKNNFYGENRLLPVSLAMITALAFIMGLYFPNISAIMKIGGFMFFVAAALSGYGNWLPQVEGGFPPPAVKLDFQSLSLQQLADEGEKIIFGGLGKSQVQGAIGKGQCPLCHAFRKGFLSERAPNLYDLSTRALARLEDKNYHRGNPEARNTVQKEAFPGSGTAETAQEYLAESHVCPSCFVAPGYGVKGSNDTESPMAKIHKPPISLSMGELVAVDTWIHVNGGIEPPSYEEIIISYEKFIPEGERITVASSDERISGTMPVLITEDDPINEIFAKAACITCHTIPGIEGATGKVGPKLMEGTNAPNRLNDTDYKGKANSTREYITESILNPSAYVVQNFSDDQMPKDFGKKLSAGAVDKIVDYLSNLKKGDPPPVIK